MPHNHGLVPPMILRATQESGSDTLLWPRVTFAETNRGLAEGEIMVNKMTNELLVRVDFTEEVLFQQRELNSTGERWLLWHGMHPTFPRIVGMNVSGGGCDESFRHCNSSGLGKRLRFVYVLSRTGDPSQSRAEAGPK